MNKAYIGLILAISLVAFGAGCGKKAIENVNDESIVNQGFDLNDALDLNVSEVENTNVDVNENTNSDLATNTNESVATNENTNAVTNSSVSNKNTNTATATGTIAITSPASDDELVSPFYVEGTASSGSLVYVRLKASGVTIFTEKVSVKNGAFKGKLLFDFSRTTNGTIDVFQKNADEEEVNLTSVDVRFKLSSTNTNAAANSNTNTNTNL